MHRLTTVLTLAFLIASCDSSESGQSAQTDDQNTAHSVETEISEESDPAKQLIMEVVEAVGGQNALWDLKDVEYEYIHRSPDGTENLSTERYIFDGELSWGLYEKQERYDLPDDASQFQQAWDGSVTRASLGSEMLEQDDPLLRRADFTRKTNLYWFAMMHKMLDPGMVYALDEDRKVDGKLYKIVKVGYESGVGDVQDTYVLYINPETKLVDQFLFTVMDFDRTEPLLMRCEYEEVDGALLMTYRKYAPANWAGEVLKDAWTEEISNNIKFNNGFRPIDLKINL